MKPILACVRLHLVDGTYELFRAHFAPRPDHRAPEGWDAKATVGVAASLLGNARVVGSSRGVAASPLADPRVQTKLVVGAPGNRYEREADSIADRIVRATSGSAAGSPPTAPPPPAESISRLGPAATSPPPSTTWRRP